MFVVLPSALRSLHLLLLIAPFNSLFFYIHFIILTSWFRRWVLKHALSPSPLIRQPRVKLVLTDGDFLLEHLLEKQNTDFHRQTYTQIISSDKDGGGLCAARVSAELDTKQTGWSRILQLMVKRQQCILPTRILLLQLVSIVKRMHLSALFWGGWIDLDLIDWFVGLYDR